MDRSRRRHDVLAVQVMSSHDRPYPLGKQGCTCVPCMTARAAYRRRLRARRRAEREAGVPLPASVQHGKAGTYQDWACRCRECTAAASSAAMGYAERRGR